MLPWTPFLALCSGLAEVVHNCKRLAQLAQQQGTAPLWAVVTESVAVLRCSLSCVQLCPREYLRSMPAAQQQQYKALSQLFLTAGLPLLLSSLAAERSRGGQGRCSYLQSLALELQRGTWELLQLGQTAVMKRSERSIVKEGVGRLLDVLEMATREGMLRGECTGAGCQLIAGKRR